VAGAALPHATVVHGFPGFTVGALHRSGGEKTGSGHGGPGSTLAKKADKHRSMLHPGIGEGKGGQ